MENFLSPLKCKIQAIPVFVQLFFCFLLYSSSYSVFFVQISRHKTYTSACFYWRNKKLKVKYFKCRKKKLKQKFIIIFVAIISTWGNIQYMSHYNENYWAWKFHRCVYVSWNKFNSTSIGNKISPRIKEYTSIQSSCFFQDEKKYWIAFFGFFMKIEYVWSWWSNISPSALN